MPTRLFTPGLRIAVVIVSSASSLLAQNTTEPAMTVEMINERIQVLESQLIDQQTERYRAKHAVEYKDEQAIPLRTDSKSLEKEWLDLRKAYEMRVRVVDEPVRKKEHEIKDSYKTFRDKTLLLEAVRGELAFLLNSDQKPEDLESQVASLRAEIDRYASELEEQQKNIQQLLKELEERRAKVTESDTEAFRLKSQLDELEPRYSEAYGQLHQSVDQHENIRTLDAKRQAIAAELQKARKLKEEALKTHDNP